MARKLYKYEKVKIKDLINFLSYHNPEDDFCVTSSGEQCLFDFGYILDKNKDDNKWTNCISLNVSKPIGQTDEFTILKQINNFWEDIFKNKDK